jgi:hypothetical protein
MDSSSDYNSHFYAYRHLYGLIYLLISMFALYLSFKCNNGLDVGSFLMALLFPYIYIPYKLAVSGMCD